VAVRRLHHCYIDSDVVEPNDAVHPSALDRHLGLKLHAKFNKESDCRLEVLNNDADVVHLMKRHAYEPRSAALPASVRSF
jgi:hypothetical protein